MKSFNEDVSITPDGPLYTAKFHKLEKLVEVTGEGRPEQGLKLAVGFKNLTQRQGSALSLGLQILNYLETGVYASCPNLEDEPGAELNFK